MNRDDIEFWISVATLFFAIGWPLLLWLYNRQRKLRVASSKMSWITLSEPEDVGGYQNCRQLAVLLDIDVTNTMNAGVSIDSFDVHYRCHILKFQDWKIWKPFDHLEKYIERFEGLYKWVQLYGPMPMKKPATVIGKSNTHRILPHRMINFPDLNIRAVSNYLRGGERNIGVLLFESLGTFWGGGRPYTRKDNTVPIKCTVRDSRNVKSTAIVSVRLVDLDLAKTSYEDVFMSHSNNEEDDQIE